MHNAVRGTAISPGAPALLWQESYTSRNAGTAACPIPNRKPSETHPTLCCAHSGRGECAPAPSIEDALPPSLPTLLNEERHKTESETPKRFFFCSSSFAEETTESGERLCDSVPVCHRAFVAQPDLAALEFPFCCLATGSAQLSAQPRPYSAPFPCPCSSSRFDESVSPWGPRPRAYAQGSCTDYPSGLGCGPR